MSLTLEFPDGKKINLSIHDKVKVNGQEMYIEDLQISNSDFSIMGDKYP